MASLVATIATFFSGVPLVGISVGLLSRLFRQRV